MKTKFVFLLILLIAFGCGNTSSDSTNSNAANTKQNIQKPIKIKPQKRIERNTNTEVNTQEVKLSEVGLTMNLPEQFKRIDLEDIKNLPYFSKNPAHISLFVESIRAFQFEDKVIDIFADDNSEFGIVAFIDTKSMPKDQINMSRLSEIIVVGYGKIGDNHSNLNRQGTNIGGKSRGDIEIMEYGDKFTFEKENSQDIIEHQTLYIVQMPNKSLYVCHWSPNVLDFKKYLLSIKE